MTPRPSAAPLGALGEYDLLSLLGEGAMGTVYRARHRRTREVVAVKVMPADVARSPVLLKRFEQEFRIAAKLDHPNVVRAIEHCGEGPTPFLVMELVEGESLGEKLEREGRLSEEEALRIIAQVAHGLHRAHRQGLIHRDIKPDNILVTPEGRAKLTDLGLAKDSDAGAGLTRTGRGLGTPAFMAPEQFRDAKNASVRCDVYALAATLYQAVTGRLPFGDDPVQATLLKLANQFTPARQLVPGLSPQFDAALRRALSADPEQRPASCREFAEQLLGKATPAGARPDRPPADLPQAGRAAGQPKPAPLAPASHDDGPGPRGEEVQRTDPASRPVPRRPAAAAVPSLLEPTPGISDRHLAALRRERKHPALDRRAGLPPASPGRRFGLWKVALLFALTLALSFAAARALLP
jgi:serine/threonine protein kinase